MVLLVITGLLCLMVFIEAWCGKFNFWITLWAVILLFIGGDSQMVSFVLVTAVIVAIIGYFTRHRQAIEVPAEPLPEPGTVPITYVQNNYILVKTTPGAEPRPTEWVHRIEHN